jgi:hypothetical protein
MKPHTYTYDVRFLTDMLRYRIVEDYAVAGHSIELDLLGVQDIFADDNGFIGGNFLRI